METHSTERLIQILDALDARPAAVRLRERSYDLLRPEPGDRVADVGCGTGLAVAERAQDDRLFVALLMFVAAARRP